ncbi:MAG TPA: hypothetical protein PKH75_14315, partial [Bacillota bacterium]|nr:hypothetical protein [Bacillota bacterium]
GKEGPRRQQRAEVRAHEGNPSTTEEWKPKHFSPNGGGRLCLCESKGALSSVGAADPEGLRLTRRLLEHAF